MEKNILEKLNGIEKNVLLKDFTTYKIGGLAKYFFVAKSKEDLKTALKVAKDFRLPVFILGGGSNLLISDKGFRGLVIKMEMSGVEIDGGKVSVGAGMNLTKLGYLLADNGLSGLEWSSGIPSATVGGAVYGHAQAFGSKMSDQIKYVEAVNLKTLEVKNLSKEQCRFSLKNSIFKKNKNWAIVSAIMEFQKKEPEEVRRLIKEILEYRKNGHPMDFPSAGSTFVNPEVKIKSTPRGTVKKLLEKFPELIEYNKKGTVPAGYLIAKCGLAGKKIGNAQISEKHANFIINVRGAKAKDVKALISLAQKMVKKTFGIELEPEVQFVGF